MPFFESVEMSPEDPILGMTLAFAQEPRPEKVNLGVGAYKNAEGKPEVLGCVRKAEKIILDKQLDKEYLPIQGSPDYIRETLKLVFNSTIEPERIAAAQTIGGTGALRLGGEFLKRNRISESIFLSHPTWPNHKGIFSYAGLKIEGYAYYDFRRHCLSYSGMIDTLNQIPSGSVVLFQPCCHNPTGLTPTLEQWKEIAELLKKRRLIPFLDFAYQGFGKGIEEDAEPVRHFASAGHEMLVSVSHSKNFGLYGERVGLLAVVCNDNGTASRVSTALKQIVRGSHSMPPLHGQRIVTEILRTESLRKEWVEELRKIRDRIGKMRNALLAGLQLKGVGEKFQFIENQEGMFSFSGLNEGQVSALKENYGIYMLQNGRINVAGLNSQNMDYVIHSILSVIEPEK